MGFKKNKILEEGGLVNQQSDNKVGLRLLISFILTAMLVVAIFVVRAKLGEKEKEYPAIVATQAIDKNFIVTAENFNDYFELKSMPESSLPENYIKKSNDIIGKLFTTDITKNTVITSSYVINEADILGTMRNPIVAGVSVDSATNMVNGTLRAGDIVDLIFYEDSSHIYIVENVYVTQVFDSNGKEISRKDSTTVVSKMNIYIEADYSLTFAQHVQKNVLYINKINYDTSEKLFMPSDEDLIKVPVVTPNENQNNTDNKNNESSNTINSNNSNDEMLDYNDSVED